MGLIQSKTQQSDTVDADHELSAPLRSTLKDLEYLFIRPQRLEFKGGHQVWFGGYGEVRLATLDRSLPISREVAVKQLRSVGTKGDCQRLALRLARELKIWAALQHRNILGLLGYYLSENYEIAQLISVYMVNGNISQYLNQNQPDIAMRLKFVQGITVGLQYLHDFNPPISHGDLKPANVLISDELDAVICDFGVASFINQAAGSSGLTTSRSVKGSQRYMSPELLLGKEVEHTLPSDIWAWACTTYEIFTNIEPYNECKSNGPMIAGVLQGKVPGSIQVLLSQLPQDETWPTILSAAITDCWNFDASERPFITMLIEATKCPSNELFDRSIEFPIVSTGEAERDSWVLAELLPGDIVPDPSMPPEGDKLKYPGAPSILRSKSGRRNLLDRLKFGSRSQKDEERRTPSPVPEGPQPMSSISASRVGKYPANTFRAVDMGVRRNISLSRSSKDTPSKHVPALPSRTISSPRPLRPLSPPPISEALHIITASNRVKYSSHGNAHTKNGETCETPSPISEEPQLISSMLASRVAKSQDNASGAVDVGVGSNRSPTWSSKDTPSQRRARRAVQQSPASLPIADTNQLCQPYPPSMLKAAHNTTASNRVTFGLHRQNGEESRTPSPVAEEPPPISLLSASRVGKSPNNAPRAVDMGVRSNRSPAWPAEDRPPHRVPDMVIPQRKISDRRRFLPPSPPPILEDSHIASASDPLKFSPHSQNAGEERSIPSPVAEQSEGICLLPASRVSRSTKNTLRTVGIGVPTDRSPAWAAGDRPSQRVPAIGVPTLQSPPISARRRLRPPSPPPISENPHIVSALDPLKFGSHNQNAGEESSPGAEELEPIPFFPASRMGKSTNTTLRNVSTGMRSNRSPVWHAKDRPSHRVPAIGVPTLQSLPISARRRLRPPSPPPISENPHIVSALDPLKFGSHNQNAREESSASSPGAEESEPIPFLPASRVRKSTNSTLRTVSIGMRSNRSPVWPAKDRPSHRVPAVGVPTLQSLPISARRRLRPPSPPPISENPHIVSALDPLKFGSHNQNAREESSASSPGAEESEPIPFLPASRVRKSTNSTLRTVSIGMRSNRSPVWPAKDRPSHRVPAKVTAFHSRTISARRQLDPPSPPPISEAPHIIFASDPLKFSSHSPNVGEERSTPAPVAETPEPIPFLPASRVTRSSKHTLRTVSIGVRTNRSPAWAAEDRPSHQVPAMGVPTLQSPPISARRRLRPPSPPPILETANIIVGPDRVKLDSNTQNGEERRTTSPVAEEPQPTSSIPAPRVDESPNNNFRTEDIGVRSNRSPVEDSPLQRPPRQDNDHDDHGQ